MPTEVDREEHQIDRHSVVAVARSCHLVETDRFPKSFKGGRYLADIR